MASLFPGLVFKDAGRWTGASADRQALGEMAVNHFGALTQIAIGGLFPGLLEVPSIVQIPDL